MDGIQDSYHEPVYPRVCEHSGGSGVVRFEANTFNQSLCGEIPRVVSTLQHVSNYDKQLKFIHGLQPWARKLIIRMLQLPVNPQDLMQMVERLGMTWWTRKSPTARRDQPRWAKTTTRSRSARSAKMTNMCTRSSSLSPTMCRGWES